MLLFTPIVCLTSKPLFHVHHSPWLICPLGVLSFSFGLVECTTQCGTDTALEVVCITLVVVNKIPGLVSLVVFLVRYWFLNLVYLSNFNFSPKIL